MEITNFKGKMSIEKNISQKSGKEYTAVYFTTEKGDKVLVSFDARLVAQLLMMTL